MVPQARGEAARALAAAEGYRDAVIARAEGEAQRFSLLLTEYEKAPQVTRKRLYLETVQEVMSRNPRVIAGNDGGTLLLQLPPSGGAAAPASAAVPELLSRPAAATANDAAEGARAPRPTGREPREGSR